MKPQCARESTSKPCYNRQPPANIFQVTEIWCCVRDTPTESSLVHQRGTKNRFKAVLRFKDCVSNHELVHIESPGPIHYMVPPEPARAGMLIEFLNSPTEASD